MRYVSFSLAQAGRLALLALTLSGSVFLTSCLEDPFEDPGCEPLQCNTPATVRNFAGLDGCGYLLVLTDGTRLEPNPDIWTTFTPFDGQEVKINYEDEPRGGICMAGRTVRVRCITQVGGTN
ncbi:hypothetical protein LJY25_09315 [Hymenobacter sp. BT175]|uniref:hypothetical protein n=1 Tax=Hymenobacter translucens TaxID=2886507 RepID=UPI001D0DC8F2|nr:hypothetical protein [Hymenobacter translucens]MCC2546638.1 hypothetical protein [Hymenobacter translucens]